MANNSEDTINGLGFWTVLFFIFLVLKLTGYITWSWWWVTSPLWAGFALFLVLFVIFFLVTLAKEIRKT